MRLLGVDLRRIRTPQGFYYARIDFYILFTVVNVSA